MPSLKLLISEKEIKERIESLANEIESFFIKNNITINENSPLLIIGLLNGAVFFTCDLARELNLNNQLYFMSVSSYSDSMKTSGKLNIKLDLDIDIKDRYILICDDIIDSGLTLFEIKNNLEKRGAKAILIAALCDKKEKNRKYFKNPKDYENIFVGFNIKNKFIVGYGMDFARNYRALKDIYIIE